MPTLSTAAITAAKRPYLSRNDRRAQLLKSAASIIDREGWDALSMVSLAKEAKTSRQLVYQHFQSIDDLAGAAIDFLFRDLGDAIRGFYSDETLSLREAMTLAVNTTLDMPAGRVNAISQVMSTPYNPDKDGTRAGKRLRIVCMQIAGLLVRGARAKNYVIAQEDIDVLLHMMSTALFSVLLAVSDGIADRETAVRNYTWAMEQLLSQIGNQALRNSD